MLCKNCFALLSFIISRAVTFMYLYKVISILSHSVASSFYMCVAIYSSCLCQQILHTNTGGLMTVHDTTRKRLTPANRNCTDAMTFNLSYPNRYNSLTLKGPPPPFTFSPVLHSAGRELGAKLVKSYYKFQVNKCIRTITRELVSDK